MARKHSRSAAVAVRQSQRLDASDWTAAGLSVLARGGVDAVRIDDLSAQLGVTKGSFYWHFKDKAHLLQSMLAAWRRDATLDVIERLEAHGSPAERLQHLIELPATSSHQRQSLELAVRLWARRDAQAAAAIDEIDQQRLTYVASLLRANEVEESRVPGCAYLIYAFILAEHLISGKSARESVSSEALRKLVGEFIRGRHR